MGDCSARSSRGVIMGKQVPQIVRVAIITTLCVMADCPIECVCVHRSHSKAKKVTCGHYKGSFTTAAGSQVACGYGGD
jgi:hypothetical protein